jgi:hypothetical protein
LCANRIQMNSEITNSINKLIAENDQQKILIALIGIHHKHSGTLFASDISTWITQTYKYNDFAPKYLYPDIVEPIILVNTIIAILSADENIRLGRTRLTNLQCLLVHLICHNESKLFTHAPDHVNMQDAINFLMKLQVAYKLGPCILRKHNIMMRKSFALNRNSPPMHIWKYASLDNELTFSDHILGISALADWQIRLFLADIIFRANKCGRLMHLWDIDIMKYTPKMVIDCVTAIMSNRCDDMRRIILMSDFVAYIKEIIIFCGGSAATDAQKYYAADFKAILHNLTNLELIELLNLIVPRADVALNFKEYIIYENVLKSTYTSEHLCRPEYNLELFNACENYSTRLKSLRSMCV